MRNTEKQRNSKGKPLPFGERPEGRPLADQLPDYKYVPAQGFNRERRKQEESKGLALRTFSWQRSTDD